MLCSLSCAAYLQPDSKGCTAEGLVFVPGSCYASELGHLGWTTLAGLLHSYTQPSPCAAQMPPCV